MIPTTFGSGSEVTRISVLKVDGKKKSFHDDGLFADVALVDPIFAKTDYYLLRYLDKRGRSTRYPSCSRPRYADRGSRSLLLVAIKRRSLPLDRSLLALHLVINSSSKVVVRMVFPDYLLSKVVDLRILRPNGIPRLSVVR